MKRADMREIVVTIPGARDERENSGKLLMELIAGVDGFSEPARTEDGEFERTKNCGRVSAIGPDTVRIRFHESVDADAVQAVVDAFEPNEEAPPPLHVDPAVDEPFEAFNRRAASGGTIRRIGELLDAFEGDQRAALDEIVGMLYPGYRER